MEVSEAIRQQSAAYCLENNLHLKSSDCLQWCADADGAIVYHPGKDKVHMLNSSAAMLLLLCDGSMSKEIVIQSACALDSNTSSISLAQSYSAWLKQAIQDHLIVTDENIESRASIDKITEKTLETITDKLYHSGQHKDAERCARILVNMAPDNADYWYLLGETQHATEDYSAAKVSYERQQEIEPDNINTAHLIVSLSNKKPPLKAPEEYVQAVFDDYADTYDSALLEDLEYKAPELINNTLKHLLPVPNEQFRVLDLGCGTGLMGKSIKPWAHSVWGVDLSSKMIAKAKLTACYQQLHLSEIEEWLVASDENFDLILAADVLIYIGDLNHTFKYVKPLMSPNSKFAFTLEKSAELGYSLTVTGRYAHHADYITALSAKYGYRIDHLSQDTLRYQYGKKVEGHVVVLSAVDAT